MSDLTTLAEAIDKHLVEAPEYAKESAHKYGGPHWPFLIGHHRAQLKHIAKELRLLARRSTQ